MKSVQVNTSVTKANDDKAEEIKKILKEKNIFCVNVMGSPGSGKTTVIENIAEYLNKQTIVVIQGDLESEVDKKRLEEQGIETYQINTHTGCHLNANMINQALENINFEGKKYLIIENVGNLVCPARKKIGQDVNILVSSTTEGSDKPKKYPIIFIESHAVVISKSDLKEYVNFSEEQYLGDIKSINANVKIFQASEKNKETFKEIAKYILEKSNSK